MRVCVCLVNELAKIADETVMFCVALFNHSKKIRDFCKLEFKETAET